MQFVTGGGLRIDTIITHDGQVHTGLLGGNALYAAVGVALWVKDVFLWARVGQNYPRAWLETLSQRGIGIEGIVTVEGEQDHRTFYAYTPDGRRDDTNPRAHFARINQPLPESLHHYIHSTPGQDDPSQYEPLALRPADWPRVWTHKPVSVHLSPMPLITHTHVTPFLRRCGVHLITVDPGERYMIPEHIPAIRQILPHIDAFLPSDQEVRSLFGEEVDLWQATDILCSWGAPLVVIKHGADGALVQEGTGGRRMQLPAYHRPGDPRVVDVTGAGDAFCGGFLVGLAALGSPIAAARMGLISASLVIEGYGASYALRLD